uniref:Uncharacterized protein n=1 Tax=Arundo donax TaxID=35708 RepID=A0A0A9DLL7_ARUDO
MICKGSYFTRTAPSRCWHTKLWTRCPIIIYINRTRHTLGVFLIRFASTFLRPLDARITQRLYMLCIFPNPVHFQR